MGYEYKEILKLDEMLNEAGIPHTITKYLGGHLIRYFGHNPIPKNGSERIMILRNKDIFGIKPAEPVVNK